MIQLTACLLLTTVALTQGIGARGAPSSVPMDFNDDIYNRDMRVQPPSNLFYNFQQARLDQPLQIEMREEDLGKYMGRPRPSTTAIPKGNTERIPDVNAFHMQHLSDEKTVSTMTPYVPQGPYNAHLPATMPPAPDMLRWMDLSDDSFKNHAQYKPNKYAVNPEPTHQSPTLRPAPSHIQWSQPPSVPVPYDGNRYESYSQQQPMDMGYSNPTLQNHASSMDDFMGGGRYIQEPSRGRGSHKFNWNEVALAQTVPPVTTTMPTPVPQAGPKGRAPPSFPTLTPWSGDSFGK